MKKGCIIFRQLNLFCKVALNTTQGFPRGSSGRQGSLQCRGQGFDPWTRRIPTSCVIAEPESHDYGAHRSRIPCSATRESNAKRSTNTTTREEPRLPQPKNQRTAPPVPIEYSQRTAPPVTAREQPHPSQPENSPASHSQRTAPACQNQRTAPPVTAREEPRLSHCHS